MVVNRKLLCTLLLFTFLLITSGCNGTTATPSAIPAIESPASQMLVSETQTIVTPALPIDTQTVSPTNTPPATPTATATATPSNPAPLGLSTGGYPIDVYTFGNGPIPVILIGGIHGGYEWNTILLAYELIDFLETNPGVLPPPLTVYIIPSSNPDGQVRIVGHSGRFSAEEVKGDTFDGRFNANGVDLNRNWDCDWSPDAVWQNITLDPGKEPFSEVETRLLRDFIQERKPAGVIFWHSAYGAVFPGGCDTIFEPTRMLSTIFADSSGYPMQDTFTSYNVTGDSTNWLALENIPSIEVELTNHHDTEFEKNLKGVLSVLEYLANPTPLPVGTDQPIK